jgi:hypothetical protein
MPRPRQRVCLQDGLKLDLNRLASKRIIQRGALTLGCGISWTNSYWGEVASARISADMSGRSEGWLRVQLGSLDQRIVLVGAQTLRRPAVVLSMPGEESAGIRPLEAARCVEILQPPDVGTAGRLPFAISRPDKQSAPR